MQFVSTTHVRRSQNHDLCSWPGAWRIFTRFSAPPAPPTRPCWRPPPFPTARESDAAGGGARRSPSPGNAKRWSERTSSPSRLYPTSVPTFPPVSEGRHQHHRATIRGGVAPVTCLGCRGGGSPSGRRRWPSLSARTCSSCRPSSGSGSRKTTSSVANDAKFDLRWNERVSRMEVCLSNERA